VALLSPQPITITGTAQTLSAATASDTAPPGDRTFLWVKTTGTTTNVTIVVPGDRYGQPLTDVVVAAPATGDRLIGPLTGDLADPITGLVTVNFSSQTGVTRALVTI
jgi:hypothetical protein